MRLTLALIGIVFVPRATVAQEAHYRLAPRDTMRYRQVIESHVQMRPAPGPVEMTSRREAIVAIVLAHKDTVTAWYEQLTSSTTDPRGERHLALDSALHLPFRLLLPPTGRVTTLSAPAFPADIARQTDLSHEFEDLFISLPGSELHPGTTWADTVANTTPSPPQDTYQSDHIRRFRVLRDTIVGETSAFVISVDQSIRLRSSTRMQSQPVSITTELAGQEQGTVIFAPRVGYLLSRARRAHLEGQQVLQGSARRAEVPLTYDYSSTLVLIR